MAENNSGESILAFLVGGIIGGALGVLLAPRRGSETRELIGDWLAEKRDKTKTFIKDERDALHHKKEQIEAAWEAGKKAYKETGGA